MATAPQQHRARPQRTNRPKWWKWYSSAAWKRMSKARIREDGMCRRCGAVVDLVADHVREHNGNPVLFWDYENTQALCRGCNSRKRWGNNE